MPARHFFPSLPGKKPKRLVLYETRYIVYFVIYECSPAQTIHKFIPPSGGTKIIDYFFFDIPIDPHDKIPIITQMKKLQKLNKLLSKPLIRLIRIYQMTLSPDQ